MSDLYHLRGRISRKRAAVNRMKAQLEDGMAPSRVPGDRDLVVVALEELQREADVVDDQPKGRR